MSKVQPFEVSAVIKYWGSITVHAENMEEALVQARKLGTTDFIKSKGEHNDSTCKIVQVYDSNFNVEL